MKCKIIKPVLLVVSLFLMSMQAGCAFGTREVMLKNSDNENIKPVKGDSAKEILFTGLKDKRTDRTIGHVQNGWGTRTAEVVAKNDVADWVNKEIDIQLKKNGFILADSASGSEKKIIILSGDLLKVYTTAFSDYLGEVSFRADVSYNGKTVFNRIYSGHNKGGTNWAASSDAFNETLTKALKGPIEKLVADIKGISEKTNATEIQSIDTLRAAVTLNSGETQSPSIMRQEGAASSYTCPEKANKTMVLTGPRSKGIIAEKLSEARQRVFSFYKDRVELNSDLAGEVCLHLVIGRNGRIGKIDIVKNTIHDPPLIEKVLKEFKELEFLKRSNDKTDTEVLFSMDFNPSAARASKGALIGVLLGLSILLLVLDFTLLPH